MQEVSHVKTTLCPGYCCSLPHTNARTPWTPISLADLKSSKMRYKPLILFHVFYYLCSASEPSIQKRQAVPPDPCGPVVQSGVPGLQPLNTCNGTRIPLEPVASPAVFASFLDANPQVASYPAETSDWVESCMTSIDYLCTGLDADQKNAWTTQSDGLSCTAMVYLPGLEGAAPTPSTYHCMYDILFPMLKMLNETPGINRASVNIREGGFPSGFRNGMQVDSGYASWILQLYGWTPCPLCEPFLLTASSKENVGGRVLPQFRTSSALRYLYATAAPTPVVPPPPPPPVVPPPPPPPVVPPQANLSTAAATIVIASNATSPVSVIQPPTSTLPTTTPSAQRVVQGASTSVVPPNMDSSVLETTASNRPSSSLLSALNSSSVPPIEDASVIRAIIAASVRSAINSSPLLSEDVTTTFQPIISSYSPAFNSSALLPPQSVSILAPLPQNTSTLRGPGLAASPTSPPAILQGKTTASSDVSQFACPSSVPAILSGVCGNSNIIIPDTNKSSVSSPVSSASVSERRQSSGLPPRSSTTPIAPSTLLSASSRAGDLANQRSGSSTASIVSPSLPPSPGTTTRIPSSVGVQPQTSSTGPPKISGPVIVPSQVTSNSPSSPQTSPPVIMPGTTMITRVSNGEIVPSPVTSNSPSSTQTSPPVIMPGTTTTTQVSSATVTPSPLPNNSSGPPEPIQSSNQPAVQQPSSTSSCHAKWGQCGGAAYSGPSCCDSGLVCTYQSYWYWQCQW